jgi:hypothetical protein
MMPFRRLDRSAEGAKRRDLASKLTVFVEERRSLDCAATGAVNSAGSGVSAWDDGK